MPRRRKLLLAAAVLLLLVLGSVGWLMARHSFEYRMAQLRLGMPRENVLAMMGQPQQVRLPSGEPLQVSSGFLWYRDVMGSFHEIAYCDAWQNGGDLCCIGYDQDGRIVWVGLGGDGTTWRKIQIWLHQHLGF